MRLAILFTIGVMFLSACTEDETPQPVKDSQTAVEKAVDATTDALRDVAEGVNDAVYD